MVKISRNNMIKRRIRNLRTEVKLDTQEMRAKMLNNLQQLFNLATELANNAKSEKHRSLYCQT